MRRRIPSSSPIWTPAFEPPPPPTSARWRLTPLHPDLAEIDYDAFMSSRERLAAELDWKGWPTAGFTLEENVADLVDHYGEFERREGYAYSVLADPRCIGCVYIESWTEPDGAQLYFWLRDDALELEGEVVSGTLTWLLHGWPLARVVVAVRPWNHRGVQVLEGLGLRRCVGPEGHVGFEADQSRS